jgi:hypothetical protein
MSTPLNFANHALARTNPPTLGLNEKAAFVQELFGAPYSDPDWGRQPFENENKWVMSMPELFAGKNRTNLGQRIIYQRLIDGNFWTQVLAPILPLQWGEHYEMQWSTLEFKSHLPQIVPEEGRTRIGEWTMNSETRTINRYGLGAEFHHE